MLQVGEKIRKIRELKGFTQDYMATQLGITQNTYSKIEREEAQVNLNRLEEISNILGLETTELLAFDEKKVFNLFSNQQAVGHVNHYISNVDEKLTKTLEETIAHLKEEIKTLRKEKAELMELLRKR